MKEAEAEKRKQKEEKRKQRVGKSSNSGNSSSSSSSSNNNNKAEENKKAMESHYQMLLIANARDHSPNITPGSSPEMVRQATIPEDMKTSIPPEEPKPKLSAELSSLGFSQKSVKYSNEKSASEEQKGEYNNEEKKEEDKEGKEIKASEISQSIDETKKEIEKLTKERQMMVSFFHNVSSATRLVLTFPFRCRDSKQQKTNYIYKKNR